MIIIMGKESSKANDLAITKLLYAELLPIIELVRRAGEMDIPEDYQLDELNRSYVLIVNELEKIADKHPDFAQIQPEPICRRFDVLKSNVWDIHDYYSEWKSKNKDLYAARLDKLCIITGSKQPVVSIELQNILTANSVAIKNYKEILEDARLETNSVIEDSWYIPEYKLDYKTDGTILINGVLRLKKTHIDSATDRLLEQAIKSPDKLFTPDLGRTSRNLSTLLSSAGFYPVLRQLFFPIANKNEGVLFRPIVSSSQASKDGIDTSVLDELLRQQGADFTFSE